MNFLGFMRFVKIINVKFVNGKDLFSYERNLGEY